MKNVLLLLVTLFLISSCNEEKKNAVVSQSPNGSIKISISGNRDGPFSPWVTDLVANGGEGLKGNISFEFYGTDLSDKTIQFAWEGNDKCTITFLERDNTKRIFQFTPNSTQAMWTDLSEK